MKKCVFFAMCICMSVCMHAQVGKGVLRLDQQTEIDAHVEQLTKGGMSTEMAQRRALSVFQSNQQVSLRSRQTTPPTKSIWVNRDPDNLTNPHPIYDTATAEDLVKNVLLSDPSAQSRITNVTFTGEPLTSANRSLAYFEHGDEIEIPKGLILSTYGAMNAEGYNVSSGNLGGGVSLTGDPHLTTIATSSVNGGSILQFDFQPYTSKVTFDFIFASEEYPDYSNASVNDAFGFFVFEQGDPSNFVNIALFPDASPVTINNSNWGNTWSNDPSGLPAPLGDAVNPQWHVPNYWDNYVGSDSIMEYDGRTVKLQAIADNLDPNKTYTLKLAICNIGDNAYGSAVFLANLDLGKAEGDVGGPNTGISVAEVDALGIDKITGKPMFLYGNRPCTFPMELKFDNIALSTNAIIDINYIASPGHVFPGKALLNMEGKQLFPVDTIQLDPSMGNIMKREFRISTDFDGFVNGQFVGMTIGVRGSSSVDTVFYRQLYDTISYDHQYRMPTLTDKGYLTISVKGGTPYVHRSIDDGQTWKPIDQEFTMWELLYVGENCDILLYQPHQCCFDTIKIRMQTGSVTLQRYVDILSAPGVTITNPGDGNGRYYVESHQDFSFTATYAEEPMTVQATGTYTNRQLALDQTAVKQADGSYKYTIRQVVEPWTIQFVGKTNSGDVSNEFFANRIVWSSGNTLYVNTAKETIVNIYTLTGVLYKQEYITGNGAIQLPGGIYIVSVDGKRYKIVIK